MTSLEPDEDVAQSFHYLLFFPTASTIHRDKYNRLSYEEALGIIQQCVGGDETREEAARREFRKAWMSKFRSGPPMDQDTLPLVSFYEVLEWIQNIDARLADARSCAAST